MKREEISSTRRRGQGKKRERKERGVLAIHITLLTIRGQCHRVPTSLGFTWLPFAPSHSLIVPHPWCSLSVALFDVPPEAFFPFTRASPLLAPLANLCIYCFFLFLPSTRSSPLFPLSVPTTFSFSFPLFSFLLLCHYLILLATLFLFLLVSFFSFCCFTTLLFTHALALRTLSSPLVLLQPPPPTFSSTVRV